MKKPTRLIKILKRAAELIAYGGSPYSCVAVADLDNRLYYSPSIPSFKGCAILKKGKKRKGVKA